MTMAETIKCDDCGAIHKLEGPYYAQFYVCRGDVKYHAKRKKL